MSFFDNWRVQSAMTGKGASQEEIDKYESEYCSADSYRKESLFKLYTNDVNKGQMNTIPNLLDSMWLWTTERYPKFKVIDDNSVKHQILYACTEAAQDEIFKQFLASKE